MARLDRIRRQNSLEVRYTEITEDEKNMIVKAMSLGQGHWFKCPKGRNQWHDPDCAPS